MRGQGRRGRLDIDAQPLPRPPYDLRARTRQTRDRREAYGAELGRGHGDARRRKAHGERAHRRPHAQLHPAVPQDVQRHPVGRAGRGAVDQLLRLHRLAAQAARVRRARPGAGRRPRVPPGSAPDRHGAPARRRHGEERPRRRRPVDARAVYPRLLLGRHGVRERRVRHYRARRPRLLHGGAARAVGPRPPTLRRG